MGLNIVQGRNIIESDMYGIVKELHEFDPALRVTWNITKVRFEVWRVVGSQQFIVKVVQNSDGTFRELDRRVIDELRVADMWRPGAKEKLLNKLEKEEEKVEKDKDQQFSDYIEDELAPRLKLACKKTGLLDR